MAALSSRSIACARLFSALIRHLLEHAGKRPSEELVRALVAEVKSSTLARDKTEHYRVYALKQAFALLCLSGIDPATLIARFCTGELERTDSFGKLAL